MHVQGNMPSTGYISFKHLCGSSPYEWKTGDLKKVETDSTTLPSKAVSHHIYRYQDNTSQNKIVTTLSYFDCDAIQSQESIPTKVSLVMNSRGYKINIDKQREIIDTFNQEKHNLLVKTCCIPQDTENIYACSQNFLK